MRRFGLAAAAAVMWVGQASATDMVQDVFADRALFDPRDEIFGDFEIDVGFEQDQPDFAQGVVDVLFRQRALVPQAAEDGLQLIR